MGFFDKVADKLRGSTTPNNPTIDEESVKKALSVVMDPDLHRDIVSLGFVRNIRIAGAADAVSIALEVNLTTPACPVKDQLRMQCESILNALPGVKNVDVKMTATTRGGVPLVGNQASALALGNVKNIIAVAAGKGGVGKSTTAVGLAYALAATGSKVGLLDADVYGPSIPLMTRPKPSSTPSSQPNMVVPAEANGVKVISIGMFNEGNKATMLRGPMAGGVIKQFLSQVEWGDLDYLIIDYPPGTGDIQLTISQTAPITGAVIVTTPQEVALIDVRKAVSMFETLKVPVLGVVETMSYFVCDGCDKKHYIFRQGGGARIASENGVAFLGEIPMDPAVVTSGDNGAPLPQRDPEHFVSKAFQHASRALAAQISILHEKNRDALQHFSLTWK